MSDKLIWYVCYGSNLLEERFLHYFDGKTSESCHINKAHLFGDGSFKPRKSKKWHLDLKLYFANDGVSSNWGTSGVAFVDTEEKGRTLARAYLISEDEYDWLRKCEGRNFPWYDKEIVLGTMKEDGCEIRTITCDIHRTLKEPMKEYLDVMARGLREIGFEEIEIMRYLNGLLPPEEHRTCPVCGATLGLGEGPTSHTYFCPKCGYRYTFRANPYTGKRCPMCGNPLVKRRNKEGKIFVACSNFPECKYIEGRPMPEPPKIIKKCPSCVDGNLIMEKRWDKVNKKVKEYLRCTNFPKCTYEEEVSDPKK